jgi:alpha-galactosidase
MKSPVLLLGLAASFLLLIPARGQTAVGEISLDAWTKDLPFYFKYDGKDSSSFLSNWQRTDAPSPSPGGQLHTYTFADPNTHLKVVAEVRTFTDFDAIDWVLHFTNEGTTDTPIIENVQPLQWTLACKNPNPVAHIAQGANAHDDDFRPIDVPLPPGISSTHVSLDYSSVQRMPYFNLQDDKQGIIGAIGWSGEWQATFSRDKSAPTVGITAGMRATHFLLHPGETVRTPRIVLLNWKGSNWEDSQNLWRRMALAYFSPQDASGKPVKVPLSLGTWGAEPIDSKLANIKKLHDLQVRIDDYWVDAAWMGTSPDWMSQRGSYTPNPTFYPNGLKPLGDALKADGYGFILWFCVESADGGSQLMTQHPDWYERSPAPGALAKFGDPAVLQGLTDTFSKYLHDYGATWLRQDFDLDIQKFWDASDTPDRVGISEMKYITGIYKFWDALRAQGLQIDNCCSGGRRLDIEATSRSVNLWRSDYCAHPFPPLGAQMETQGIIPWVPLNAATFSGTAPGTPADGASLLYTLRSCYSAGFTYGLDRLSIDMMKRVADEFREVRPYFYGDYYSLTPYTDDPAAWSFLQLDRPDQKDGLVICLRRPGSPTASMKRGLHAIDPNAQYDVELRTGLDKVDAQSMSGQDLANIEVSIPDKPGSVLIFYKQQ